MSLNLIFSSKDAAQAASLRQQLAAVGITPHDAFGTPQEPVLVLLSPQALDDAHFMGRIYAALDSGHHIIPVITEALALPAEINHLTPIHLGEDSAMASLRAAMDASLLPAAGLPLKVLTPATRRSNARAGLVIGLIAFGMFVVGVLAIAVFNIEAPLEEYNLVDTEVAQTRDLLIAPTLEGYLRFLPGSAAQALEYPATVQAVPTRIRPFVAATATAVAIEQGQ